MYKAKILEIKTSTYLVAIPSLQIEKVEAYLIIQKGQKPCLSTGDLVLVSQTNDKAWVILGYVYGQ